ncbi:MAG: flavodoxin family protein [Candidatus Omnitrophica bacterium]|nr:flavodoxin family protein [Candidatus Omnitrophota bacterium]MBU4479569.1 flavodoxin family protein [Candidatus Omnitrophota bacterium]
MSTLFSNIYRKQGHKQISLIGILGSPRLGGNCDILLEKALEGAAAAGAFTEKIVLNNLSFVPCQACESVRDDGYCAIEDDFQCVHEKILEADALLVACPIYFGSISAQTKMMIDRFHCYWRARNIVGSIPAGTAKRGGFICVQAGERKDFFNNAAFVMKNFFATVGAEYGEELLCANLEEKGKVSELPALLHKAFSLGQRLAAV